MIDKLISNGQLAAVGHLLHLLGGRHRLGNRFATTSGVFGHARLRVADAWVKAHEADNLGHYGTSKQAINAYVATHAFPFLARAPDLRDLPGSDRLSLARANADLWLRSRRTTARPPAPRRTRPSRWAT